MNVMLIVIVVLVVLLLVVVGILAFSFQGDVKQKQHKIDVIRGGASGPVKTSEGDVRNKRRAEIAKKLKEESATGEGNKKNAIDALLQQAGMDNTTVKQFWMYSGVFAVFAVVLVLFLGQPPHVVLMVGITALLGLPRMFLKHKIKRRQKKFLEEFADALEAMVRLLKAGMPVGEAILMASREFEGPVGEEMSKIYDAQKIGVPMAEAALEASHRMPLTEMQMFATGISIQAQTGASLSEVLTNLAGVIRARFRLQRKVKALSSEAKVSASIIGCLPVFVGGGLFLINRDFMMVLFTTSMGKSMLAGGTVWMSFGILSMKIMINFKV